jgi:hypothetical protein
MNDEGIYLDRGLLLWEWFSSPEVLSLYVYLLLRASTKDNVVFGEKVSRGQFLGLRKTFLREVGLSPQKLTTALGRLQRCDLISIVKIRHYYLITLLRYDDHACSPSQV